MNKQAGKEAFMKLIQQHQRIIFKICNAYCKNQDDREDLAQEMIYQLWKSLSHFNPDNKFSTWMYRVALNVAISFYRKERKAGPRIPLTEHLIEVEDTSEAWSEVEENISHLQRFISQLKELDRALMILYLEEKSYKEIAEILGITETNVATKLSRIKDKLKQYFSNQIT
jgi:RNA polymerase sigma factor (sigma-70 family)